MIVNCRTIIRSPAILNHHSCGYLLHPNKNEWIIPMMLKIKFNRFFSFTNKINVEKIKKIFGKHNVLHEITSCACFNSEEERKFSSPKGSSIRAAIYEPKQNTSFFSRYDLDSEFPFIEPSFLAFVIFVHPIPCKNGVRGNQCSSQCSPKTIWLLTYISTKCYSSTFSHT